MSKECAMYGNQCEYCPIKEICWYLFDLPFGRTDTNAYLKIYQQGKADAIDEVIKTLAKSEDTILTDKQYYTLMDLKGAENE